jgi:hypothetical protein
VDELTREAIDERVHFLWTSARYAIVWGLSWTVSLVFDYARALAALRDRPPLRENLVAAVRLVASHKLCTFSLSASLFGIGVALVCAYWALAPGAGPGSGAAIVAAFALGQAYLLARIGLRAWFLAAQTAVAREIATSGRSDPALA